MDGLRIELAGAELPEALVEAINARLREHNRAHSAEFWAALDRPDGAPRPLNVVAFDVAGGAVGGLLGETRLAWLKIHVLSVDGALRGQGIATRLVTAAETEAVRRGCRYAYADTMQHQSPAFYRKLGYREAGRLDDWDSHGHAKFFFVKPLV